MSQKFFCEVRPLGGDETSWRPIPAVFGAGRYEVDSAAQAEAELRLWQRTPAGRRAEFRVRRPPAPDKPKTEEKRLAEVAKAEATSKSVAKSITAAKKQLAS